MYKNKKELYIKRELTACYQLSRYTYESIDHILHSSAYLRTMDLWQCLVYRRQFAKSSLSAHRKLLWVSR